MRAGMCVRICLAAVAVGLSGQLARGQDNPNPEQIKKMYDDALLQLKAAQERKNQLAAENEKLKQQIDAMTKEMSAAKSELGELRKVDAAHAERTFFLRSHYMAWQTFAKIHPETADRWQLFLESAYLLSPKERVSLIDRDWPAAPATQPATPPATLPTTEPATTQPAQTQSTHTQPTTQPATQAATQPTVPPAATQPAATSPAAAPVPSKQEE